ncbi:MAG: phosphatase PAP2 family protein [Prevotella sp.]|nr:phosphatase PAP2 family protein [Prevotella sp.]
MFTALTESDRYILAFFNGSDSLFMDNLSVVLTSGLTWIPLYLSLLYVVIKNNETMRQIMLVVGCALLCIVLSDGVADFVVKPLVARLRPTYDPLVKYSIDIVNGIRGNQYSFFSAHASNTFCIAMFFSLLIRNRKFIIAMVLWSLINCWTRLYLGVHYPSDILVGLLWGAIVGLLVYSFYFKVYRRISSDFNYISTKYTSTGYSHEDIDIVLLVMVLTLLYVIVRTLTLF